MHNFCKRLISGSSSTFTRPQTSTRHPTPTPTDKQGHNKPRPNSAQNVSTSSISSPDPCAIFDQADSSVADTVSIGRTSAEVFKPACHSELGCYPYRGLSNQQASSVYYRIFGVYGLIRTVNPVYTDDPYLGRISVDFVTPPHTAANLKHCLSSFENIDENIPTSLFRSSSSQTPMDDNCRVSYPCPGCKPDEPMALVAMLTGADRSPVEAHTDRLLPQEGPTPFKTQYRKYPERLFNTPPP